MRGHMLSSLISAPMAPPVVGRTIVRTPISSTPTTGASVHAPAPQLKSALIGASENRRARLNASFANPMLVVKLRMVGSLAQRPVLLQLFRILSSLQRHRKR